MKFDSINERTAAPAIAALGGIRCDAFAPPLPTTYLDADGVELTGKPDFVIKRGPCVIYIELKDGRLNDHYTRASSREALEDEFRGLLHRCPDHLSYSALSTAVYESGRLGYLATLEHGFNHSLWKLLALQAHYGWRHYIVCFKANPKPEDAKRYCDAGLVWCTLNTLPQLVMRIELEAAGIPISFVHRAQKFEYEVTFDNGTASPAEARSHFLAAVAADQADEAAKKAADTASVAAGILPF
jgi:hypothetical protein